MFYCMNPYCESFFHPSAFQAGNWDAEKVIEIPNKKVENWMLPEMPGRKGVSIIMVLI